MDDSGTSLRSLFAALADGQRLRLLRLLFERPASVGELVDATGLRQPLVSHHLSVLARAGFVAAQRTGRFRFYRLAPSSPAADVLLGLIRGEPPRGGRSDRSEAARGSSLARPEPPAAGDRLEDYLL